MPVLFEKKPKRKDSKNEQLNANQKDEDDEDLLQLNKQDEITFMSVIFKTIEDEVYIIVAADNGELYICNSEKFIMSHCVITNGFLLVLNGCRNNN